MPLGRGLMCIGRLNIYHTTTIITSISPILANCGDTVIFHITVTNNIGGPTPTGTVSIVNTVSGTVLATGTLTAGSVNILTTPNVSIGKYIAIYSGVHNMFETSVSNIVNYNVGLTSTITIINTASNLYFCYAQPVFISAHVSATGLLPTGSVRFLLYSNDNDFIELAPGILNGSGNASSIIPSFTTMDGYDYWLQAVYDGYGCWNSSESSGGTLGNVLHSVSHCVTNTVVGISGSDIFCAHDDITLIAGVISSTIINPSFGTVTYTATNTRDLSTMELGTSGIVNGSSSLLVPGNTFLIGDTWSITAYYISDGYCYNNSTSSNSLILTPTLFDTEISISGPNSYCYNAGADYIVTVSSLTKGEIKGELKVSLLNAFNVGIEIYRNIIIGSNTGIDTLISISGNKLGGGVGSRHLSAQFTADTQNCYKDSTSADYAVSVLDC